VLNSIIIFSENRINAFENLDRSSHNFIVFGYPPATVKRVESLVTVAHQNTKYTHEYGVQQHSRLRFNAEVGKLTDCSYKRSLCLQCFQCGVI